MDVTTYARSLQSPTSRRSPQLDFYRETACNKTQGIANAPFCPSFCLSVKRVHCDKMIETCATFLTVWKNVYPSLLTRRMVGGMMGATTRCTWNFTP